VTLATHENVSDEELELALSMASSVALNNDFKAMMMAYNSLTPEEKALLDKLANGEPLSAEEEAYIDQYTLTPEQREAIIQEQIDMALSFGPGGVAKFLRGVADKLKVPFGTLLERVGLSGTKVFKASAKSDALKLVDDLPEAIQANTKRYFQKTSNKYTNYSVEKLSNGTYKLSMTKPGNVPGSYAVYEKTVDSAGVTINMTKTTVAPDGSIIHIKDK
jgi:hypothetical protein